MRPAALLGLAALLSFTPAEAQWDLHGHVKYQFSQQRFEQDDLAAQLVAPDPRDHTVNVRLNATYRRQRLDVRVDSELIGLAGDTLAARGASRAGELGQSLLELPNLSDTHQWFDLGRDLAAIERAALFGRLDRLSVGYTGDRLVARLGRQPLSWGNGLVFQTLDLFNPFPPNVLDADYKPGRDMLTTQWLFASGDDVQVIVVPGRADRHQPLTLAQSAAGAKWHHWAGGTEVEVLAARHHGDTVLGGGASRGIAGGVWRIDLSHVRLATRHVTSLLVNIDRAFAPGGRNLYAFGEYFYNGFGASTRGDGSIDLDADLATRLERGELFNLGRHELAGGLRLEWTALLTLSPTVITNLTDGSTFALVQVQYDWRQDLVLHAGLQSGLGARGTEFGGVAIRGSAGYLAPGTRVWARLARYF